MQFAQQKPTGRLISLTPLIDVVFILLIFFMLAASFLDWRSVDLTISSGVGATKPGKQAMLISLQSDGSVAVGSEPIAMNALQSVILARLDKKPEQHIVIRSDPGVTLQRTVNILDLVRSIGATNVTLARKH